MNHGKSWTIDDEVYLMKNFNKMDIEEMALKLGRKAGSLEIKYKKMARRKLIEEDVIREVREKEEEEKAERNRIRSNERYWENKLGGREKNDKEDDEFVERAYQNVLRNSNRDYGIGKKIGTLGFELGKFYEISRHTKDRGKIIAFKGVLIQETKDLVTLNGMWLESFLKKDFLTGEYEIREVN